MSYIWQKLNIKRNIKFSVRCVTMRAFTSRFALFSSFLNCLYNAFFLREREVNKKRNIKTYTKAIVPSSIVFCKILYIDSEPGWESIFCDF